MQGIIALSTFVPVSGARRLSAWQRQARELMALRMPVFLSYWTRRKLVKDSMNELNKDVSEHVHVGKWARVCQKFGLGSDLTPLLAC